MECFLLILQGRRVFRDVDDKVSWTKSKDGKFSVKTLYKDYGAKKIRHLFNKCNLELIGVAKGELLCMGGHLE